MRHIALEPCRSCQPHLASLGTPPHWKSPSSHHCAPSPARLPIRPGDNSSAPAPARPDYSSAPLCPAPATELHSPKTADSTAHRNFVRKELRRDELVHPTTSRNRVPMFASCPK